MRRRDFLKAVPVVVGAVLLPAYATPLEESSGGYLIPPELAERLDEFTGNRVNIPFRFGTVLEGGVGERVVWRP